MVRIFAVRSVSAAVLALVLGSASMAAGATTYSKLVVFGDSLSDTGNLLTLTGGALPQPSAYWNGRFSNGPVAVEWLAQGLGIGLENYAYGGATTGLLNGPIDVPVQTLPIYTGVQAQVGQFEATLGPTGQAAAGALYVVWAGANDIRYLGATPQVVATAIQNLAGSVAELYAHGARDFLLPNLPDLGLTPYAASVEALYPGTAAGLSALSEGFNLGLHSAYASLRTNPFFAGANFIEFNTMGIQRAVAANPGAYGFSNVTTPCFSGFVGEPGGAVCANPSGLFYWDSVHPSAQAQQLLGQQMLAAVPEPASMLLMAVGTLALLGLSAHRRQRGSAQG